MHHRPLVNATTHKVHQHGNHRNNAKHAAWPQRLLRLMHAAACVRRPSFEKVCALIYGCNEGYRCFGEGLRVAEQGYDGRFAARVFVV